MRSGLRQYNGRSYGKSVCTKGFRNLSQLPFIWQISLHKLWESRLCECSVAHLVKPAAALLKNLYSAHVPVFLSCIIAGKHFSQAQFLKAMLCMGASLYVWRYSIRALLIIGYWFAFLCSFKVAAYLSILQI
jgi:hypothetical protein